MSYVTEFPVAEPQEAVAHFLRRLSVETDCADVHHALINNQQDFVLLHVVGQAGQFAQRHLPAGDGGCGYGAGGDCAGASAG
jgi:hypothetical protein